MMMIIIIIIIIVMLLVLLLYFSTHYLFVTNSVVDVVAGQLTTYSSVAISMHPCDWLVYSFLFVSRRLIC